VSGISWVASGNPAELTLSIAGQDPGNRLLGTYSAGNSSAQQPRFHVSGEPQSAANHINLDAFTVPGIGNVGPYPRNYLRNPGFNNHDLSLFMKIPFAGGGRRTMQMRHAAIYVLQHTEISVTMKSTQLTHEARAGA